MSLITSTIPNIVNGVSQQPQALRMPSQGEEQINGLSSIAEGLRKRPAFRHVAKMTSGKIGEAFVHIIDRDRQERYVVILHDRNIRVFDINGNEKTVNKPDGTTYLTTDAPQEDLDAVTVADYTFVLNKNVMVEENGSASPSRQPEALIWVKQGEYGSTYTATVNGLSRSYSTPDGSDAAHADNIATDHIAADLRNQLASALGGAYSVSTVGSVIWVRRSSGSLNVSSSDSIGNTAMLPIGPEIQRFGDLPAVAPEGFEVEVTGDQSSSFDNYYVKFSDGTWKEVIKQGESNRLWAGSMPHALVREADGSFTFRRIDWEERKVGDLDSNPFPSFVDQTMNGIFFHRNRLGVISGENVVMSKSGDFFNFFRGTATQVLDDDPIDVGVSHTKVSILRHAVAFSESLLLFSDQTQFQLGRADILTPDTVSVNQTTEYETSMQAKPGAAGRFIYFIVNRGSHSGVREYYVDRSTETSEATDITGHVPQYIPGDIYKLATSSNEDILVALSKRAPNEMYVYRYYWADQEKIQASWSRWLIEPHAHILNCEFIESDLYIVVEREDGVSLEVASLNPGYTSPGMPFAVHMDRLCDHSQVYEFTYDGQDTTFELSYRVEDTDQLQVVTNNQGDLPEGIILSSEVDNSGTWTKVRVPNRDLRGEGFFVGITYDLYYRFSELAVREEASGGGQSTVQAGRTQVRKISLLYSNAGYFKVNVTPFQRQTYEYVFSGRRLGSARNPIGQPSIEDGTFDFPVLARNTNVDITLTSDSFLPCAFLSAEWEAFFTIRSKRI